MSELPKKLQQLETHLNSGLPFSEFPGITPLKKLDQIEDGRSILVVPRLCPEIFAYVKISNGSRNQKHRLLEVNKYSIVPDIRKPGIAIKENDPMKDRERVQIHNWQLMEYEDRYYLF